MAALSQARVFKSPPSKKFDKCRVLLFEAEADFRRHTREMLDNMGFGEIHDTGDFEGFQTAFGSGDYDLVIGDTGEHRGNVCDLVHRVRHNVFGADPFPGVILTMADPSEEKIRRVANSGTDHLLAKPYSPNQVLERIRTIIDHRKRFIVTLDYVGPERREGYLNATSDELIRVPNALRAKVLNDPSARATPKTVRAAMHRINLLKIRRHDLEIGVLVELLCKETGGDGDRRDFRLKKLDNAVATLQTIVPTTEFVEATKMCDTLSSVITELRDAESSTRPELDRLEQTSMALHLCFHPDKTVSMIIRDIADAVVAVDQQGRRTD
jgi:DNA-binding response OmpR family regulator